MPFTEVAVYSISRKNNQTSPRYSGLKESIQINADLEDTLREIKVGFLKKLSKVHGQFSAEHEQSLFSLQLKSYDEGSTPLREYGDTVLQHFVELLGKTEIMLDAHILFAREDNQHNHNFYAAIVHHKSGHQISPKGELVKIDYLNTDEISLLAKVDLGEWRTNDPHLSYLTVLVSRGERELNECFLTWLGFANKANVKEQTDAFIEAVESYVQQQPKDNAQQTREQLVNYCIEQDRVGNKVTIDDLSDQIESQAKSSFANHIKQEKPDLQHAIIPDRSKLKQYMRISGRNELLSMSFDTKCLGESIIYDEKSDKLVINNLPAALKTRLLKHLNQNGDKI